MALEILVNTGKETNLNRSLDLYDDSNNFVINYLIADINNISNTNGTYTKTIDIPDTKNNREIFGYITNLATDVAYQYDNNFDNSFNPNLKYRCTVMVDTVPVLEGYLQLTKYIDTDKTKSKSISITIYGDNASFFITMGDKLLTDIDFSDFNFTYSVATIKDSWDNSAVAYKKGYYFPLIDYGHGWTLTDLQNTGSYTLKIKDFLPAVYVKTIVDKVFASNGFAYDSKFLGSNENYPDARFRNLVIPFKNSSFVNNEKYNQDKIFHAGLSFSLIGQYTKTNPINGLNTPSYPGGANYGRYNAPGPQVSTNGVKLVNYNSSITNWANAWYNGYMLSPFYTDASRNNNAVVANTETNLIVPFNLTETPMFNTSFDGIDTYNTSGFYYTNAHNKVFKQRFILKTDVVTTYTMNNQWYNSGSGYNKYTYRMYVQFYREIDPLTGTTSAGWAGGTGSLIPPDLGSLTGTTLYTGISSASASAGYPYSNDRHWICDPNGNSNVFDVNRELIRPRGANRYLGKYCTTESGYQVKAAGWTSGDGYYKGGSGDCLATFYSDGYNGATSSASITGLWTSGMRPTTQVSITEQPFNGDWYQNLIIPTIFLDGDEAHPLYGTYGSLYPKGNTPIQPGERVRCVVTFGGKYKGQFPTATPGSYKPPSTAFLVTSTIFDPTDELSRSYTFRDYTNNPLTQFYNEVSLDYITGQEVNFNDVIPKNIKQRDFIQDIVKMHNLYIEPVKYVPDTLVVEPRDVYYLKSNETLDWSDKIDLDSPIDIKVLAETQNRRTRFSYKSDSDYYNKQYTEFTNEVYGQFIDVSDNEFLTNETKIESLFSPTPVVQLYAAESDYGSTLATPGGFIIPVFVNGSNVNANSNSKATGNVTTNYRILYKNYIQNLNDDQIYLFDGFTHSYPYAGMYDNPYSPAYSINWGQTKGEFFFEPTNLFFDNLVNSYWSTLLTELTDEDSRLITCQMFLTPNDINNFQFYKQVFLTIDGVDGYYKVNSIEDYTPGRNSLCKVTLLKSKNSLVAKQYSGSISTSRPPVIIGGGTGSGSTSVPAGGMAGLVSGDGMVSLASRTMPMNSLTVGYDNQLTQNNIVAIGSDNTIDATNTLTIGNSNFVTANRNSNVVVGDSNSINSTDNSIISGSNNTTIAASNTINIGDNNSISGDNSTILGNNNINSSSNNLISGNNNLVDATNTFVLGNSNTVTDLVDNIFIFGNNISASASNQMIIDPNIKVQPASIIQDFTPRNQQDNTYPEGAITKSDNDLWVRTTNLGWRQIPFNNSYGSFYNTTSQVNVTASQVNHFTFDSGSGTNVSIINGSKITADYDGLYNIQFSAQIHKPSGGTSDIDIWLMYNGVNVEWSNTRVTLQGNGAKTVAAWNFIQAMTASSYCQLAWSSADDKIEIYSLGTQSTPNRPGIPSVILTIDKISSL